MSFGDLASTSISGPDPCPHWPCLFAPLKIRSSWVSWTACFCARCPLQLAYLSTFVCLSNYVSSLKTHLNWHLLWEAISNNFRQNAVLLLPAPKAPSNFSSTLFINLLKNIDWASTMSQAFFCVLEIQIEWDMAPVVYKEVKRIDEGDKWGGGTEVSAGFLREASGGRPVCGADVWAKT